MISLQEEYTKRSIHFRYQVFGTSRNPETSKGNYSFELLSLDITSESSIEKCLQKLQLKTDT